MARISFLIGAIALVACQTGPEPPSPGMGTLHGQLTLVPPAGVQVSSGSSASYGDRRLRDVSVVDYDRPGFAVVYLRDAPSPGGRAQLRIRESDFGLRLEPETTTVGLAGTVVVRNDSPSTQVLSCPELGLVRSLAPEDEVEVVAGAEGLVTFFVLGSPDSEASIFVAPGPYCATTPRGRFELRDVPPGSATLCGWHPRFPGVMQEIEVQADQIGRVDLRMSAALATEAQL